MALPTFYRGFTPSFNSALEDFFNDDFFVNRGPSYNSPRVNVIEHDDHFMIDLAAPGMEKEDFELKVEDKILKVRAEKREENEENRGRYAMREFKFGVFERSFSLPESIDATQIDAKYDKGILHIKLSKKEEAKKRPPRLIEIQ